MGQGSSFAFWCHGFMLSHFAACQDWGGIGELTLRSGTWRDKPDTFLQATDEPF